MTTKIEVNNLSKKYRIGETFGGFGVKTFRDVFVQRIKKLSRNGQNKSNEIWALKDVSFKVAEGEVLGIIGRNGAGKSTLLKVLSRITRPTEGTIKITGRIASLLEVGTGFNMELTGRENIFLNGSILGMKKKDIQKKFDEIVAFAEIEKFIDTPLKRYSSGMYMRLAFSVAAHIEPDILIVDEVLAVGDFEFQKKCIGKMKDVSKAGRTVLFVSHNMGAVENLCKRVLVIKSGEIVFDGNTLEGINLYLRKKDKLENSNFRINLEHYEDRDSQDNIARISMICLKNNQDVLTNEFRMGDDIIVEIETKFNEVVKDPIFDLTITNSLGQYISNIRSDWEGYHHPNSNGLVKTRVKLKNPPLTPGTYYISPEVVRTFSEGACLDIVHLPICFHILNKDITGFGSYTNWDNSRPMFLHIKSKWEKI